MKTSLVADGEQRLRASLDMLPRASELRESEHEKHAGELEQAGFFRRILIRCRIAAGIRRARRQDGPSPYSLYGSESGKR